MHRDEYFSARLLNLRYMRFCHILLIISKYILHFHSKTLLRERVVKALLLRQRYTPSGVGIKVNYNVVRRFYSLQSRALRFIVS